MWAASLDGREESKEGQKIRGAYSPGTKEWSSASPQRKWATLAKAWPTAVRGHSGAPSGGHVLASATQGPQLAQRRFK